jgi:hypothetical protein
MDCGWLCRREGRAAGVGQRGGWRRRRRKVQRWGTEEYWLRGEADRRGEDDGDETTRAVGSRSGQSGPTAWAVGRLGLARLFLLFTRGICRFRDSFPFLRAKRYFRNVRVGFCSLLFWRCSGWICDG